MNGTYCTAPGVLSSSVFFFEMYLTHRPMCTLTHTHTHAPHVHTHTHIHTHAPYTHTARGFDFY